MLGNIFILGDSYSTFEGYIPSGYSPYYGEKGPWYAMENAEYKLSDTDVCDVTDTWWYNLARENGTLIKNCSWSGTTICNTGYDGCDNSDKSFIARLEKLIKEGFFEENRVDTVFLFGGTNDSWSNAPLGEKILNGWTKGDLYNVFPAFSYLIDLLVNNIPGAKIYCITHSELKDEIEEFYTDTCNRNGVEVIRLNDIDKVYGHPTVKGMLQIKNQILDFVK